MKEIIDAPNAQAGLKDWLIRLVKGILIGIGGILPGLSGGVLSVIFGVYQPAIRFLSHIRDRFWAHVRYFFPVGLGGILGVLLFSVFVEKAFGQYAAQFVCLFIGFVIGTFPSLYRQAGEQGRDSGDLFLMALWAVIIFSLMFLGKNLPHIAPSPLIWFFSGAVVSLGFIVPGMSPSNFLIYFGLYDKMAGAIAGFDFTMILPFSLGMVLCVALLSKLAARLFDRHYAKMYHSVLGMVIGSTAGIFPAIILPAYRPSGLATAGLSLPIALLFGGAMLVAGILVSYQFSKLEERVSYE